MVSETDKPAITLVCCGLLGSVVADEGLIERSFAEAIATQGVVSGTSAFARRMAQVHQARGLAPGDVLGQLFPDNEARAQAALLAFDRALADALGRVVLRPLSGAGEALDQVRASGCRVCLLTSLPRRALEQILDAAGLRRHIDLALSAQDVARGFPAPDLVLTALLRTRAGAVAEVAVVHSTSAGVEAGRRAGAGLVAGLPTGPHSAARLRSAGATRILRGLADLPGVLAESAVLPGSSGAVAVGSASGLAVSVPAQAGRGQRTSGR